MHILQVIAKLALLIDPKVEKSRLILILVDKQGVPAIMPIKYDGVETTRMSEEEMTNLIRRIAQDM